jgi:hypothetical protein
VRWDTDAAYAGAPTSMEVLLRWLQAQSDFQPAAACTNYSVYHRSSTLPNITKGELCQ